MRASASCGCGITRKYQLLCGNTRMIVSFCWIFLRMVRALWWRLYLQRRSGDVRTCEATRGHDPVVMVQVLSGSLSLLWFWVCGRVRVFCRSVCVCGTQKQAGNIWLSCARGGRGADRGYARTRPRLLRLRLSDAAAPRYIVYPMHVRTDDCHKMIRVSL